MMGADEIKVGDRVRIGNVPAKEEFLNITGTSAEEEFEVLRVLNDAKSASGRSAVISRDPFRAIDLSYLEKVNR